MSFRTLSCLVALCALGCASPTLLEDVVYDSRYESSDVMDVYLPSGGKDDRPAVLLVHGGGWKAFSKSSMRDVGQRLASSGYVAAAIDYRLVPEGAFPHAVQDSWCALSFLRAHAAEYQIDPRRIAAMGYSAGGHLVSMLGTTADVPEVAPDCDSGPTFAPAAVIDGAGVVDMRGYGDTDPQTIVEFLGGTRDEVPEVYDLASPVRQVNAGDPPFLIIHGGGDWFVPIATSYALRDALRGVGSDARLMELGGGGHLLNSEPDPGAFYVTVSTATPEAWLAISDFLSRTVGAP